MNYSMTPMGSGTRLRTDHNTFASVITSYGISALVQGDVIWTAPTDGNEVKKGDIWLHVTHVSDVPVVQGWMAYIHKGAPICRDFVDNTQSNPPDPEPETPAFPESFTLTDPSGIKAEYVFVRIIEE